MKIVKFTALLACIISISCACKSKEEVQLSKEKTIEKTVKLVVKEIFYQSWVAGVKGGGSGTKITFTLSEPLDNNTQLVKMILNGGEAPIVKISEVDFEANFKRTVNGSPLEENVDQSNFIQSEILPTTKVEIHYVQNNRKYIQLVENLKEKEMIAYPSMRKPTE